jgi:lipopolysaccharide biosynthesis glycosyltransferase
MRIMLGYDPSEHDAYAVARFSIERRAGAPVRVSPIVLSDLQRARLYTRPTTYNYGQLWDILSQAPMSTEFAISRFFIPHLVDSDDDQWVLFADSDIVCQVDIAELFAQYCDPRFALYCVKHRPLWSSEPKKMGKQQKVYPFKNWSSVMLWNVRHPAHRALDIPTLNTVPGRDLHAFMWLDHDLIGTLEDRWNWLINVNPEPPDPAICHFTLGGPWLSEWPSRGTPYDHIWLDEKARYNMAMEHQR